MHCHQLSFLLVHLLKFISCPDYLTRRTAQVFISLMRFLLQSLVSKSFLVSLGFFFLSCARIWWCLLPIFSNTWKFTFFLAFRFFLYLAVLLLLLLLLFSFLVREIGITNKFLYYRMKLTLFDKEFCTVTKSIILKILVSGRIDFFRNVFPN